MWKEEDLSEGSWKLIIATTRRKVTNNKTKESKFIKVYKIITNDKRNLLLGDWIEDDNGLLEIGDKKFKQYGSPTAHPNYAYAINSYLRSSNINPKIDIESPNDVIKSYEFLISEAKRLYDIDNIKNIV